MVACIFRTELTVSLHMIFSFLSSYFYEENIGIFLCLSQSYSRWLIFLLHETLFCRPPHGSFSDLCDVSIFYVFLCLSTFPASIIILLSSLWLIFLPQPFLGQTFTIYHFLPYHCIEAHNFKRSEILLCAIVSPCSSLHLVNNKE